MLIASGALYAPILIALAGSGGFVGALLGLVKLRGETDSQAVSQAQGAMETMQELNDALERERDYWRDRFERCHAEKSELLGRLLTVEQRQQ